MIVFRLNKKTGIPPYLQLVQQVRQALQVGILQEGDQLPTVKEAVAQIAINPNTVFKAYRELEAQGLVEGRTGSGTFVRKRPAGPPPETQQALADVLQQWVTIAKEAGLSEASITALVDATIYNNRREHGSGKNHH